MSISFSNVQFAKALFSISSIFKGMEIWARDEHPSNELDLIVCIEGERVISFNDLQSKNDPK